MQISKIYAYNQNAKFYNNKKINVSFASRPTPKETFSLTNREFFERYGGYRGIMTYNEILSLKNFAEKSKQNSDVPNVAYALFPDVLGDFLYVTNQEDLINKKAQWSDITDYDNV